MFLWVSYLGSYIYGTHTSSEILHNGSQLQAWVITKGLPPTPVGWTITQYYQLLCNMVENLANQQECP